MCVCEPTRVCLHPLAVRSDPHGVRVLECNAAPRYSSWTVITATKKARRSRHHGTATGSETPPQTMAKLSSFPCRHSTERPCRCSPRLLLPFPRCRLFHSHQPLLLPPDFGCQSCNLSEDPYLLRKRGSCAKSFGRATTATLPAGCAAGTCMG